MSIKIFDRLVGPKHAPIIIAEMSANHNGSFENAKNIIFSAKKSGASAVKLQSYRPDTITINSNKDDFMIKSGLWKGKSLFDLYESASMPWDWHKPLFDYARKINMPLFSSPFDKTAIDMLEDVGCPAYKIASFEAIDLPLISYAARTGKPMIISTGMANKTEINEAIEAAQESGCKNLAILHCVSGYPAKSSDYNIRTISNLITETKLTVGLSDHTQTNTTAIVSIALGASIIEKHFTMNKNGGGADDSFSIEPHEFERLVNDCNEAWNSIGEVNYNLKETEKDNVQFRRSIYFIKDVSKGSLITEKDIQIIRPGNGIAPKFFVEIIAKKLNRNVKRGDSVQWEYFE